MNHHGEQTNQIEKQWQPEVEGLEQRIVPGMLTITTSSGETMSRDLNSKLVGKLSIAQEHSGGVITWTP